MERLPIALLALVIVILSYGTSAAWTYEALITLYSDEAGTSCSIPGSPSGSVFVYVFHEFHPSQPNAIASQWRLENNGTGFVYVTDFAVPAGFTVTGDSQAGIHIEYDACKTTKMRILTVVYAGTGTALPCSSLRVEPHPDIFEIRNVTCAGAFQFMYPSTLSVNPDGITCHCGPSGAFSTDQSTWGGVKALYEE